RGTRSHEAGFPLSRHAGVWAIPALVLIVNVFWWLPGVWLIATKGQSDLALVNPEPVLGRLWTVATTEAPVLVTLWGGVPLGLAVFRSRRRGAAMALGTFMAAGFFWGYLAGAFRTFDPLQPGRHTYAFYTAAALATGIGLAEIATRLRRACPDGVSRW